MWMVGTSRQCAGPPTAAPLGLRVNRVNTTRGLRPWLLTAAALRLQVTVMSVRRKTRFTFTCRSACALSATLFAIVAVHAEEQQISFTRDVKPLLARRCFACHGPDVGEGGL